jgi:hypothetical protein
MSLVRSHLQQCSAGTVCKVTAACVQVQQPCALKGLFSYLSDPEFDAMQKDDFQLH